MDNNRLTISRKTGNDEAQKKDPKKIWREKVYLILSDRLMIALALIMVPIVIIPILFELPQSVSSFFTFIDYTILGIFIAEYFLKTALAENILKRVLNPWHILDLLVIVLPVFDLLQLFGTGIGRSSLLLRLLRIIRIVAAGGRAVDRKNQLKPVVIEDTHDQPAMEIGIVDDNLENIQRGASLDDALKCMNSPTHTWTDFSSVSEDNLDDLSRLLGIPRLILEGELVEESYPRIDYFEHYSMIFARLENVELNEKGAMHLSVNRAGLLIICYGNNIITISKRKSELFSLILGKAKKYHTKEEPLAISILYTIVKYALEKDNQIITALEQELMKLESLPLKERPSDFLENTFYLKKEVNQIVPSLLHMKEIVSMITSKSISLEGFQDKHERLFDMLADEAAYLYETAGNARDNLLSLIDLYINTTSFELNKVMRVIAVITCLGVIPALAGLFGSNLIGNPWNFELWQLFGGLLMAMISMGWVFYKLGWLK